MACDTQVGEENTQVEKSPCKPAAPSPAPSEVAPPVRQMEIQCKGGQMKVMVGSRDGGPVRTKRRKKNQQVEVFVWSRCQ